MLSNIKSWFKELCPYCSQKLVIEEAGHFHTKSCPDGHYKIETHPALEVEIEYHAK